MRNNNNNLDLARELKKVQREDSGGTNCSWSDSNGFQKLGKAQEELKMKGKNRYHSDESNVKICYNTQKSP